MKDLFPHNKAAADAVRQHFAEGNRKAAVVHATGTGKSYIIAAVTEDYERVLIIAPNNFVLDETRKVCHAGCEFRTYASVMYDEGDAGKYDLIVLDEFHRSGAEKWGAGVQRLIDVNPQALLLGTSATHIRYLDNQRNMADELFDGQVMSYLPLKAALDQKILQNPTYVSSIYSMDETIRLRKQKVLNIRKKDLDKEEVCRRLDGIAHNWENAGGVPAIIRKYYHKDMQRIIVFCSKVRRAAAARLILGKWFGMAGYNHVRYYNIDYKEKQLKREMEDFLAPMDGYDLKVAISVNMLNEGVHIPHVDGVIMLRSTVSRIIVEQQVGRCLTSDNNGTVPVVLDLVNNMDLINYDETLRFGETNGSQNAEEKDKRYDQGFPFKVIDECRDMRVLLEQLDAEIDSNSHTKEECMQSALKYKTKKEWAKGDNKLYAYARIHGWLDECCAHMTPIHGSHTKEECMQSALKYKKKKEWEKGDKKLYSYALKYGWLDECCAHMTPIYGSHTNEECMQSALKYKTKTEWEKGDKKLYAYARIHGWLDECCAHMTPICSSHTNEECMQSALKYKTKTEWAKGDKKLYAYARKYGWIDECCAHMIPGRKSIASRLSNKKKIVIDTEKTALL